MKRNKLLTNLPYEASSHAITFIVVYEDYQQLIPYPSFRSGIFRDDRIELRFEHGTLEISGSQLEELWNQFQMQDIRLIRCNRDGDDTDVVVKELKWQQ